MKPIDSELDKHCASCIDKARTEPGWDRTGDPATRYVCGERPEWTGNLPCTHRDVKECPL